MQAIIDKEATIRAKNRQIHKRMAAELIDNQKPHKFAYSYPTLAQVLELGRMDAVIYGQEYREKIHRILNYKHGTVTPTQMGFVVTPGPSLAIKLLGTRIDSDVPKSGFYTLILPTNISEYGTMNIIQYLGTPKQLPLLQRGDIVFGEAGFHKGRSIVLVQEYERCTTNAHGLYARRSDGDIDKAIFFRCIFNWYRDMRLVDIMAVGGSGGHLSPSYFDGYIRIFQFPDDAQTAIARLYHNPIERDTSGLTLDNFVETHRKWNTDWGIAELDAQMKALQKRLNEVVDDIIANKQITLDFTCKA